MSDRYRSKSRSPKARDSRRSPDRSRDRSRSPPKRERSRSPPKRERSRSAPRRERTRSRSPPKRFNDSRREDFFERNQRTLFIGNLPFAATEENLLDMGPFRSAQEVRIARYREDMRPKGFCHIAFKDEDEAERAFDDCKNEPNMELDGRKLTFDFCGAKSKNGARGGVGGRRVGQSDPQPNEFKTRRPSYGEDGGRGGGRGNDDDRRGGRRSPPRRDDRDRRRSPPRRDDRDRYDSRRSPPRRSRRSPSPYNDRRRR